ncbi:hypothetical protein BH24ACI4_BH24ACI4_04360 [soil metagenome]
MALYGDVEDVDGYLRDACVFRNEVTTYDTMTATVKYDNDVIMSYSLSAYLPVEGFSMASNGDLGRIEIRDDARQPFDVPYEMDVTVIKAFGKRTRVEMRAAARAWRWRRRVARPDLRADARFGAPGVTGLARRRDVLPHGYCRPTQLRRESPHRHCRPAASGVRASRGMSRSRARGFTQHRGVHEAS